MIVHDSTAVAVIAQKIFSLFLMQSIVFSDNVYLHLGNQILNFIR